MYSLVLCVHVIICIVLILLILVQRGKGADMGSSFGAGASATVFGAAGSASFLVKLTAVFGILFFVMSIVLGAMSVKRVNQNNPVQAAIAAAEQGSVNPLPAKSSAPQLPSSPVAQ